MGLPLAFGQSSYSCQIKWIHCRLYLTGFVCSIWPTDLGFTVTTLSSPGFPSSSVTGQPPPPQWIPVILPVHFAGHGRKAWLLRPAHFTHPRCVGLSVLEGRPSRRRVNSLDSWDLSEMSNKTRMTPSKLTFSSIRDLHSPRNRTCLQETRVPPATPSTLL